MIKLLRMADDSPRPLAFYLATEEWLAADTSSDDDYFMTWRVRPTVIIGRHQSLEDEVDTAYCRSNGVDIVRRKSGGGAVYADMGNVMFSYIAFPLPGETIRDTFHRFTSKTSRLLQHLGVDAQVSGRNDLTVDGCKVSGYSYLVGQRRHIIHGTLLYDVDVATMSRVLTPRRPKLEAHGVKSVRSRVTALGRYLDMPVEEFRRLAEERLSDAVRCMTPRDEEVVRVIESSYYRPGWLEGHRHVAKEHPWRVSDDGSLSFSINLDGKRMIESVTVTGDLLTPVDLGDMLTRRMRGCAPDSREVSRCIDELCAISSDTPPLLSHLVKP